MERFIKDIDGKILTDVDGRFFVPAKIPGLDFEIESTEFPPTGHTTRYFRFDTRSLPQTIYIDFGDGSPIFEEEFVMSIWRTNDVNNPNARTLHTYADGSKKTVKVWFSRPEEIRSIYVVSPTKWNWVGSFPLNISLYNLDEFQILNTRFDDFPFQLSGGSYYRLNLNNITNTTINFIPKWIYSSKINILMLSGGFDLSDLSVSNFEKLVNTQGLTELYMSNIQADADNIPNTLKDISTLRILSLGNIPITEIPTQLNNCKQVTDLRISANSSMTSWGVGVANMPNLNRFIATNCENIPTDILTGIETSGVDTYNTSGDYKTVERVDASILSAYNKVTALASMEEGNTLLRNITWYNGTDNPISFNSAPTGIYQAPSGYVQGVSNGTPASALEMIYVLTKQYHWEIRVNTGVGRATITYNKDS